MKLLIRYISVRIAAVAQQCTNDDNIIMVGR